MLWFTGVVACALKKAPFPVQNLAPVHLLWLEHLQTKRSESRTAVVSHLREK